MKGFVFIGILSIILGALLMFGSGYTIQKPTPVTVVNKLIVAGGYKSSGRTEMVFKTEDGYLFDAPVSATAYTVCEVGEKYIMNLSPMQIRQTFWNNLLCFFGPVLLLSVGVAALIISFGFWVAGLLLPTGD